MEIYRQYPRKVARDSALRAIEKRLDQGLSKEDLLDAVRNYAAAVAQWPRHDRERFVPYPASWFNGGRFADDPATWQRNDGLVPAKKEMGGSGSWAQRMNARDQAHEDELATLRVVPLHEPDPDWDWRSIARELYDFDFEDWHAVPFDNRKEIERAHNETSQPIPA